MYASVVDRFWAKVVAGPNQCWAWTGSLKTGGYGRLFWDGKSVPAHRASFLIAGKSIPTGLVMDHLCRNPRCVNPDHLEPVTHQENARRGIGPEVTRKRAAAQTRCKRGHPFTPENTYYYKLERKRHCRACVNLKNYRKREMQKIPHPTPRVRAYAEQEAEKAGISVAELISRDRRHPVAMARRRVAVRLADDGFNNSQIAHWMGLDPSTVHYYMQGKSNV